ncbi:hypothetical protein F5I97DRAFT_1907758, partial [Phlebopus sp. FC_14]
MFNCYRFLEIALFIAVIVGTCQPNFVPYTCFYPRFVFLSSSSPCSPQLYGKISAEAYVCIAGVTWTSYLPGKEWMTMMYISYVVMALKRVYIQVTSPFNENPSL